jgi:hypothetical protein
LALFVKTNFVIPAAGQRRIRDWPQVNLMGLIERLNVATVGLLIAVTPSTHYRSRRLAAASWRSDPTEPPGAMCRDRIA